MIVYVDNDHENIRTNPEKRNIHFAKIMINKVRFEQISGLPCLIQHYREISLTKLLKLRVKAIIISGNSTDWPNYDMNTFAGLNEVILSEQIPIFAICGGLQVIGMAHNIQISRLRMLHQGEEDPNESISPGYFKEIGYMKINVIKKDPIFKGIGNTPTLMAMHYKQLDSIPKNFEHLASSDECGIQVIKHREKPIYGFQLHPEAYCEGSSESNPLLVRTAYPDGYETAQLDGKTIISNFFSIAGV